MVSWRRRRRRSSRRERARIRIRTSCVLPSDRRVLPRCQVAAAITPACPPPCAQCVIAHWYAQCLIGFASPVIPHACLIEGPRDGGRIGNRPETRGGARASVDQCRPGQWVVITALSRVGTDTGRAGQQTQSGIHDEKRDTSRTEERQPSLGSAVPTSECAQHPAARPLAFSWHVVVRDGCRGSNGAAHSAS